ncbi:MAG: hypothetical protein GFH27_549305n63 [Chloroflexi bacterium AL-W]|nr:hypothetical protein [Chloroflexi bacterium AL-N1]NOK69309.1 hypothetical protein [Chloroflexi bacterium AL-N10]NOK76370.1 hypothetical protein [Chloroflexi bacterium AL-N5]NOK83487.1 hypothetical protein [Chloroflexi bacterium AL-W]NOK91147.1 hypothetical protein [Chloroflexi bacterium AL-N15]
MQPDFDLLAAYLDGLLDEDEYAEVRTKILTDPAWAMGLEQLHRDAERITRVAVARPIPDVRAAVHAKRQRIQPMRWVNRLVTFSGMCLVLLLIALLVGSESSITMGPSAPRLFVVDRSNDQLLVLDPDSGTLMERVNVGPNPSQVLYDAQRDQLYVFTSDGVEIVNPDSLAVSKLWSTSSPFERSADMVFDSQRDLLYISSAEYDRIFVMDVDNPQRRSFAAGSSPTELALTPDSRRLFAIDSQEASIWVFELPSGDVVSQWLNRNNLGRRGWLTPGYEGDVYVLRSGQPPLLHRFDPDEPPGDFAQLDQGAPVWDITRVSDKLVVARGDGERGGIDIIDIHTLTTIINLDPLHDQHMLVNGSDETVFALNWVHGTITHYNIAEAQVLWRVTLDGQQPYEGVFVPRHWRFPR